jgi:hypothetical protein
LQHGRVLLRVSMLQADHAQLLEEGEHLSLGHFDCPRCFCGVGLGGGRGEQGVLARRLRRELHLTRHQFHFPVGCRRPRGS